MMMMVVVVVDEFPLSWRVVQRLKRHSEDVEEVYEDINC